MQSKIIKCVVQMATCFIAPVFQRMAYTPYAIYMAKKYMRFQIVTFT